MDRFQGQDLIHEMALASGVKTRFAILVRRLADIGLDSINYAVFDQGAADFVEAEVQFLTTLTDDFMDYYRQENLVACDPHVKRLRRGEVSPYRWTESDLDRAPTADQVALRAGIEAGLRSTLCVPLPSPTNPFLPVGAINLGSSMSSEDFTLVMREHGAELVGIAHIFHNATIRQVWAEQNGVRVLSVRERDCLRYLARGFRHDAIAHIMGVAPVTIELHIRNARKKMGARTATEAVAKALIAGAIEM